MNPQFIKSVSLINECLVLTNALSVFGIGGQEIALYVSNWHYGQKQELVDYWETDFSEFGLINLVK